MPFFEHQAMATQFSLNIDEEDEEFAASVAQQCWSLLDELELKLSRFVPDSDISRINKLEEEGHALIDFETWDLLKKAIQASQWSGGAFDIGVAEFMNIFRATKQGILNEFEANQALTKAFEEKSSSSLYVDPESPQVFCIKKGMQLDLGGIGKGYALDKLKLLLEDQGVEYYTLDAGESTVLTGKSRKEDGWGFTLSAANEQRRILIQNVSVSASGAYHQGMHIFDPRSGSNRFAPSFDRVWVCCDEAAYSDAFSTAFFLMNEEEVKNTFNSVEILHWVALSRNGQLHFFEKTSKFQD